MHLLNTADILFIGIWALIGSILGFFAFNNSPEDTPLHRLYKCLLSIGIGLFIAFPLCEYLQELNKFPRHLNIMLGGLGAFGLPDFILKYWPKLLRMLVDKLTSKYLHMNDKNKRDFTHE